MCAESVASSLVSVSMPIAAKSRDEDDEIDEYEKYYSEWTGAVTPEFASPDNVPVSVDERAPSDKSSLLDMPLLVVELLDPEAAAIEEQMD